MRSLAAKWARGARGVGGGSRLNPNANNREPIARMLAMPNCPLGPPGGGLVWAALPQ